MTSAVMGLWQLAVAVMILIHMSASFPSLERHQRQIELKLMHDAGMRREYEKAAKLLETLMNYKRRKTWYVKDSKLEKCASGNQNIPSTSGAEDDSDFFDKDARDSWSSEDKLLKMKTCLQYVQNLDASFSDRTANGAVQTLIHSICQLIAKMKEETSGAAVHGSQE